MKYCFHIAFCEVYVSKIRCTVFLERNTSKNRIGSVALSEALDFQEKIAHLKCLENFKEKAVLRGSPNNLLGIDER